MIIYDAIIVWNLYDTPSTPAALGEAFQQKNCLPSLPLLQTYSHTCHICHPRHLQEESMKTFLGLVKFTWHPPSPTSEETRFLGSLHRSLTIPLPLGSLSKLRLEDTLTLVLPSPGARSCLLQSLIELIQNLWSAWSKYLLLWPFAFLSFSFLLFGVRLQAANWATCCRSPTTQLPVSKN